MEKSKSAALKYLEYYLIRPRTIPGVRFCTLDLTYTGPNGEKTTSSFSFTRKYNGERVSVGYHFSFAALCLALCRLPSEGKGMYDTYASYWTAHWSSELKKGENGKEDSYPFVFPAFKSKIRNVASCSKNEKTIEKRKQFVDAVDVFCKEVQPQISEFMVKDLVAEQFDRLTETIKKLDGQKDSLLQRITALQEEINACDARTVSAEGELGAFVELYPQYEEEFAERYKRTRFG